MANSLKEKQILEGFNDPEELGNVMISDKTLLNVSKDFIIARDAIYAKAKAARDAWEEDLMRYWGNAGFWDDDYDWYDDEYYGHDWSCYNTNKQKEHKKKIEKYQRQNPCIIKSQKFVNGIEVDDPTFDNCSRYHKTRRGGKNKKNRYGGGSVSNKKREFYNEWDGLIDFEDENDTYGSYGNDSNLGLDDIFDDKRIIVYRSLNNTADTYEFNNVHEFSDWLDENGVSINDDDTYEIIYRQETHCAFDPQTSDKVLVCASNYEDLVYFITGGDMDYLAEISAKSCPV